MLRSVIDTGIKLDSRCKNAILFVFCSIFSHISPFTNIYIDKSTRFMDVLDLLIDLIANIKRGTSYDIANKVGYFWYF